MKPLPSICFWLPFLINVAAIFYPYKKMTTTAFDPTANPLTFKTPRSAFLFRLLTIWILLYAINETTGITGVNISLIMIFTIPLLVFLLYILLFIVLPHLLLFPTQFTLANDHFSQKNVLGREKCYAYKDVSEILLLESKGKSSTLYLKVIFNDDQSLHLNGGQFTEDISVIKELLLARIAATKSSSNTSPQTIVEELSSPTHQALAESHNTGFTSSKEFIYTANYKFLLQFLPLAGFAIFIIGLPFLLGSGLQLINLAQDDYILLTVIFSLPFILILPLALISMHNKIIITQEYLMLQNIYGVQKFYEYSLMQSIDRLNTNKKPEIRILLRNGEDIRILEYQFKAPKNAIFHAIKSCI